MWRVRLLDVGPTEMLTERPASMGHAIRIDVGINLTGIMAIGQNRWTFNTTNLGLAEFRLNGRTVIPAMRLVVPNAVERCQRREYYRFETTALNLPRVELWPLLDPASVVLAERANEVGVDIETGKPSGSKPCGDCAPPLDLMPNVGPKLHGTLMNVGGGGVGVRIDPKDASGLGACKLYWIRLALPDSPAPICASAKLVHTHIDSTQSTYAGLAFDFTFNPAHQQFVVDQICRYIAQQQRLQLQRQATQDLRRSA